MVARVQAPVRLARIRVLPTPDTIEQMARDAIAFLEPPGRVRRHVHQPVHRHRRATPACGHRRRRPPAAAGARLAPDVYFGWQFATKAARPLPGYAVRHYIGTLAADPGALHASFAIYRALDVTVAQNQQRKTRRLTLPVLGIGGAKSLGEQVADTMKLAVDDVQTLVIPGCGHHPPARTPPFSGGLG